MARRAAGGDDAVSDRDRTGVEEVSKLISFDIDGTLEIGDPPGYITIARVREALALGYIIGSCSDWPVSHQQRMWKQHGIPVSFTVLKHHLDRVKADFVAEEYVHIG